MSRGTVDACSAVVTFGPFILQSLLRLLRLASQASELARPNTEREREDKAPSASHITAESVTAADLLGAGSFTSN